jgi:hypothetical protein
MVTAMTLNEIAKRSARVAARFKPVSRVARLIVQSDPTVRDTYAYLRDTFIKNGKTHHIDERARRDLISRFERIDNNVPIASSPTDGLFMAEILLNVTVEGPIVECGCYAGGSSAKLSILGKLLGRKVVVCDSFEGLPAADAYNSIDRHCRRFGRKWSSGQFAAGWQAVQTNIDKYGELSTCSFIKGWFEESLTDQNLPDRIAFVFSDVDIPSSVRICFSALWPRLGKCGAYVTHDAPFIKALQEFYNRDLWVNQFKEWPPILFGAGYGLCDHSPALGYMVKGDDLSADYLKSLTIGK